MSHFRAPRFLSPHAKWVRSYKFTQARIIEEMHKNRADDPVKRLSYSLIGLCAGDATLLIIMLFDALRVRALLLESHIGDPGGQVPLALQLFVFYGVFAFAGWLLVGLPIAFFFPARTFTRLAWPLRLIIGAALGPIAMFIIFFLLAKGQINSRVFTGTGMLWIYSIAVSTVSFAVYAALLGKSTGTGNPRSQAR